MITIWEAKTAVSAVFASQMVIFAVAEVDGNAGIAALDQPAGRDIGWGAPTALSARDPQASRHWALPWVRVEKEYRFDTNEGTKTLAELFDGRSQLIVRHFMHGPKTPAGCPGCTFETDNLVGAAPHLAHRDVTFILASRSPLTLLNAYKARTGWTIEWVSCENAFNDDFYEIMHVPTPRRGDMLKVMELMKLSAFALEDGIVYHTYSTYDRGTEALNATWQLLDRAPKGRGNDVDGWPRKRDEYPDA